MEHVNLVFVGHVDSGKSTLCGQLLVQSGAVDEREVEKLRAMAKENNRESWWLAYLLDTDDDERARGKTVHVGRAAFEGATRRYVILDAPGHRSYVPNMIAGACQADVAVLMISARKGEFEAGFERGGQTREHMLLCRALGVQHVVVAVNKMDDPTVGWSAERLAECRDGARALLRRYGFRDRELHFVPLSALAGVNVCTPIPAGDAGTSAPSLLATLDALALRSPEADAPILLPVQAVELAGGGVAARGKVERGTLRVGDTVRVLPADTALTVHSLEDDEGRPIRATGARQIVRVGFRDAPAGIVRGDVIAAADPRGAVRGVQTVRAHCAIDGLPAEHPLFTAGFECMLHAHALEVECTVERLFGQLVNGGLRRARFAKEGATVVCDLRLARPSVLLPYDSGFSTLSRFALRTQERTVALGKVVALVPEGGDRHSESS